MVNVQNVPEMVSNRMTIKTELSDKFIDLMINEITISISLTSCIRKIFEDLFQKLYDMMVLQSGFRI